MSVDQPSLAYIGFIKELMDIPGADRIVLATAVCGHGGIWRGIVSKESEIGEPVVVFQPDSLLPSDSSEYAFMSKYGYRVKQRRFKGVASESLIMSIAKGEVGKGRNLLSLPVGADVTMILGIRKYTDPRQVHFNAETEGLFPQFVPKTDEPNAQKVWAMIESIHSSAYYITLKMDGMSSTAFRDGEKFGVCSRNLEIKDGDNAIWRVVHKYKIDEKLPDGYAIQWETVGPGIQGNPIGLKEVDGFAFQIWSINEKRYLNYGEFLPIVKEIMPNVPLIETGQNFYHDLESLQDLAAKQVYPNGNPAEGIVVRPRTERWEMVHCEMQRISFKVINLNYKN